MSSRMEIVVFALVWYAVLACLALLVNVQEVNSEIINVLCGIVSVEITFFLYRVYLKVRNRKIIENIERYLSVNNFGDCAAYIDREIAKHKKTQWLQLEKVRLMALRGDIAEFKAKIISIDINQENAYALQLRSLKALYDVLNGEVIRIEIQPDSSHLDNIIWVLANRKNINTNMLVEKALLAFDSQYTLIKAVAAKILSVEYSHRGDQYNAELFDNKVKEFVPSDEVYALLEKSIN